MQSLRGLREPILITQLFQEYPTKFQKVMVILNVHTEAENILPMLAKNRSIKVTLLGVSWMAFLIEKERGNAIPLAGVFMMLPTRNRQRSRTKCGENLNSSVIACYRSSVSFGGPV